MQQSNYFKGLMVSLFLFLSVQFAVQAQPQWQFQNTGFNFILTGITFPGNQDSIGYAVGMSSTYNGSGIILKTTNAGNTWTQLNSSALPGLESVCFTSVDTGYIGGWQNYFAKTTNGGLTWTTSTVNANIWYVREVEFFNSQKGIVVGAGSEAYVTNNGGSTWTAATGFINAEDVTYASSDTLYAVGGDEKIARSVNGGLSWSTIYSGVFQNVFLGVDFYGKNHGMVVGEDGKILTTTNGGNSWTVGNVGSTHLLRVAHLFDSLNFMAAGTPEGVFVTSNGGLTWTSDFQGGNNYALYSAAFTPSGSGFISGSQGRILKKVAILTAGFTVSSDSVCAGDSVIFTQNCQGNPNTWEWTFFGGTPSTYVGAQPPAIYYPTAGLYDFQLVVRNAAGSDSLFQTALMQVFNTARPQITSSGTANVGDTVTYQVTNQPNHTYTWRVQGGQIISGQGSRSVNVLWPQRLTGQVAVTLSNVIGCTAEDSLQVSVGSSTSVNEHGNRAWRIYPNPATTWINIDLENTNQELLTAFIYDMAGRKLRVLTTDVMRIAVDDLPAGVYYLELKNGQTTHRKQFIKQ